MTGLFHPLDYNYKHDLTMSEVCGSGKRVRLVYRHTRSLCRSCGREFVN